MNPINFRLNQGRTMPLATAAVLFGLTLVWPIGSVLAADKGKPEAPDKAPAKPQLDNASKAMIKALIDAEKLVYDNRSGPGAANYFKGQWIMLKMVPELAEKTPAVRALMAAEDKDMAAFLKANDATIKDLNGLMVDFQQKLGLSSVKIDVPRRMTAGNPAPTKVVSTDISLSDDPADKGPKDVSKALDDGDRKQIADFENFMKRLSFFDARKEWSNSERDWAGCASNYAGAYYFMLLVQQDPRYALAYPESYKFVKSLKSGKVIFPKDPPPTAAKPAPAAPAAADPATTVAPAAVPTPAAPAAAAVPAVAAAPATPSAMTTAPAAAAPAAATAPATPAAPPAANPVQISEKPAK